MLIFSHSCGKNTPVYLIFSLTSLICVGAEGGSPLSLSAFAISAQLVIILSRQDFTTPPWGIVAHVMGFLIIMKQPRGKYWLLGPGLTPWLLQHVDPLKSIISDK